MWVAICLTFGFICLIGAVAYLCKQNGKTTARLDALKAEVERIARERERANKIIDNVSNMSDNDVRRRLQERTGK